jgi:hypothetical protein
MWRFPPTMKSRSETASDKKVRKGNQHPHRPLGEPRLIHATSPIRGARTIRLNDLKKTGSGKRCNSGGTVFRRTSTRVPPICFPECVRPITLCGVHGNLLEQAIDCDEATAQLSLIRDAGRRVVKKMLLTGAMLAFISTAHAQVVIQSPGHRPVYALPRGNGTYVIPGQRPTYITPR